MSQASKKKKPALSKATGRHSLRKRGGQWRGWCWSRCGGLLTPECMYLCASGPHVGPVVGSVVGLAAVCAIGRTVGCAVGGLGAVQLDRLAAHSLLLLSFLLTAGWGLFGWAVGCTVSRSADSSRLTRSAEVSLRDKRSRTEGGRVARTAANTSRVKAVCCTGGSAAVDEVDKLGCAASAGLLAAG